jgi:hypothetical protein
VSTHAAVGTAGRVHGGAPEPHGGAKCSRGVVELRSRIVERGGGGPGRAEAPPAVAVVAVAAAKDHRRRRRRVDARRLLQREEDDDASRCYSDGRQLLLQCSTPIIAIVLVTGVKRLYVTGSHPRY